MADKKISQLTAATTPLAGTEVLPIVQGTATVRIPVNNLFEIASPTKTGLLSSTDWTTFNNKQDAGSYAVTNAGQTFTGVQKFTDAIVGGSSNVNFEILGANAYTAIGIGPGISRACKIAPVSDSGYVGWQFSSLDTFTNSSQLPSDASLIANILKVNALNNNVEVQAGNLVIGTSGKGIDFSATAGTGTSELLTDYEEGTWTPAITGLSSGSIAYKAQNGTYTKIGRLVTVQFWIRLNTLSSPVSSELLLSGLPYTSDSASTRASIAFRGYNLTGVTGIVGLWMNDSSTTANLIVLNNGASSNLLGSNLQLDAEINATFSYVAA